MSPLFIVLTYLFIGSIIQLACEIYRLDPRSTYCLPIRTLLIRLIGWPLFYPLGSHKIR